MTWVAVAVGGSAVIGAAGSYLTNRSAGKQNNQLNKIGQTTFDSGNELTSEGLGDLRNQQATYTDALKNPLGTGPNSAANIFARARGGLSDQATRATNTLGTRLQQQARQSGGNLSPEAQAELAAQNERETNQNLFEGNVAISNAEASATLSENSKLFDRLDNISRTILGVGQDERLSGLQAILASLGNKYSAGNQIVGSALAGANTGLATYKAAQPTTTTPAPLGGG